MSHTEGGTPPWWEVELAFPSAVERVVVWNRDDGERLAHALSGAKVEVLNESGVALWEGIVPNPAGRSAAFAVGLVDVEALRPK